MNAAPHRAPLRNVLFPGNVAIAEGDPTVDVPLRPLEEAAVHDASAARRQEFRVGRTAARAALAALGCEGVDIPRGPGRLPRWPNGFVGSISHAPGLCVAAAARVQDFAAIGLDVEVRRRVGRHLLETLCSDAERGWMAWDNNAEETATLVFSAKEAVYKCLHPLTGARLGFHDVEISPDLGSGDFAAAVHAAVEPRYRRLTGRFAFEAGHVLTAIALPAAPGRR